MLTAAINTAQQIRDDLSAAADAVADALLRDSIARRALAAARSAYDADEVEIRFELVHTAEGRNAEQRAAEVDRGLIRHRTDGALAHQWAALLLAQTDADEAKVALDIAARRYRAAESAAELQTAILRALSR